MNDHVSICICTFRRNAMLERLLRKIKPQDTGGLFDFAVVVVDNDAEGPARETVLRLGTELGMEIAYDIEPERTIPAARNRALRLARGNYIAIVDDDEFPPQHWLFTMYRAIQTFEVEGALGPVHPFFDHRPPRWLLKGRFCERPVHRTGTLLDWSQTRTGNVLLKKEVFDKHGIRFDPKWKTSGSDRAFFKQAIEAGNRFVAVEEAPVYESVPEVRWTRRYYYKRALIHGFNSHRNVADTLHGFSRIAAPLKSAATLFACVIALPFCAFLGNHRVVRCIELGLYQLSWLCALVGIELVKERRLQ